jgi:hypothetical protein
MAITVFTEEKRLNRPSGHEMEQRKSCRPVPDGLNTFPKNTSSDLE